MSERGDKPRIARTVLGDIDPKQLGPTSTHEHLIVDLRRPLKADASREDHQLQCSEIELGNYYDIRRGNFNFVDRVLDDVVVAISEVSMFQEADGQTIVDATSIGLGRNPAALRQIAESTGVNIVMGTGYYVREFQDEQTVASPLDQLTEAITNEIIFGESTMGIRPGVIGEIGMTSPWNSWDEKSLRAGLRAHRVTGAPVMIHPGREAADMNHYLKVIDEEGVNPRSVCISHIERTLFDPDQIIAYAKHGTYLAFDLFGQEMSYYPLSDIDMPNDGRRIQLIRQVAEAGHLDQMLVSQDIYRKTCLVRWGGEGYGHILQRVVPMMRRRGMNETDINVLIRENPRNYLSFSPKAG